jgi:3D (Asp-Asp-Asp) domain-containing protein
MLRAVLVCFLAFLLIPAIAAPRKKPVVMRFTATAFSVSGTTAKGNSTKAGTAAADPSIIPLGSKVRVTGAGPYSGVYVVTDTGPKVAGRMIDLFIPSAAEAKAFGRKHVRVEILAAGDNVKNLPETAPKVPDHQLAPALKP